MTSSIQEYVITKSKRKLEWHIPTQQWTIVHDNIRYNMLMQKIN